MSEHIDLGELARDLVSPQRFGHLAMDRMPDSELDADRMLGLANLSPEDKELGDTVEFDPIGEKHPDDNLTWVDWGNGFKYGLGASNNVVQIRKNNPRPVDIGHIRNLRSIPGNPWTGDAA